MPSDISSLGIVSYAGITLIAFVVGMIVKKSKIDSSWIPFICAGCGAIAGVAFFLIGVPDFPADNVGSALVIGLYSGLTAVGIHQAYKQKSQNSTDSNSDKE